MPVLVTCKFDKDPIKGDWEKLETSFFFTAQRHVTPKWLVRYDRNSNSSGILCLSSLPVSLMETEFIVTGKLMETPLSPFKVNGNAQGRITVVKSPTRPTFKLIQDFMPVLVICKFDKDPIKGDWENTETPFFPLHVNGNFLLPW